MNIWRKESLWQKIYSDLLSQLIRGDIVPGSPLPSCSQLQKKYRAGRETIIEYITTGVKPAPVLIKNKLTIRET